MDIIIGKLLPPILIFTLGYFLKKFKFLEKEHADFLLRLNFYVVLPALYINSITKIPLSANLLYLPIIPILTVLITFCISYTTGTLLKLSRKTMGVFLVGTMIMNTGFVLPFFLSAFGSNGIARLSVFDVGNGLMTFGLTYYIACRYGEKKMGTKLILQKVLFSPALIALVLGIVLNMTHIQLPAFLEITLQSIGNLAVPFIMLSLGVYFSFKLVKPLYLLTALIIRFGFGLLIGLALVKLFGFSGIDKTTVLVSTAAPLGYNTLLFSSLEGLDNEFAASLIPISIILGFIITPTLIAIFH